jgi:predicted dehydrogenase
MKPVRVAAIGLGWVTLHRHIPALLRNPAFRLAGVIDPHPGRAEQTAQKLGLAHFAETDDLAKVEWFNDVDAVTIGAPPMIHAALAVNALAQGKHVLTEKPFAMTVAEGEAMADAARAGSRVLAVVHNFQFSRAARKLANDLARGRLGNIRRIAAVQLGNPKRRLPDWYEQLPLGLFYDESPHFFYLLRGLAGGMLHLQHAHGVADSAGANTPRFVSMLYMSANALPVTIDCQFDSALSEWYVLVTGERALGILDIFRDIYLRLPNDGAHTLPQVLRTSVSALIQHAAQHVPNGLAYLRGRLDYGNDEVFARFARAIYDGASPNGIGIDDALAVLKLQHEATAAIERNMFR